MLSLRNLFLTCRLWLYVGCGCAIVALLPACDDNPEIPPVAAKSWRTQSIGVDLFDVHMFAADDGAAVGRMGAVYRVKGGRLHSTFGLPGTNEDLVAVWGISANDFFVIAYTGGVHHYYNGVWTEANTGHSGFLRDVWGDGTGNVYVVGHDGVILRFDGADWRLEPSGTSENFMKVHCAPGGETFVAGSGKKVLRRDGGTWTDLDFNLGFDVTALWAFANDDVYAVAGGFLNMYDGAVWNIQMTPLIDGTEDICGTPEGDLFAARGTRASRRVDEVWTHDELTDRSRTLEAISGASSNSVVSVGKYGTVAAFDGGGWKVGDKQSAIYDIGDLCGAGKEMWAAGWGSRPGVFDGGSWQWEDPPFNEVQDALYAAWIDPAGTVWAAGQKFPESGTGLIARLDGGTWTTVFITQRPMRDIWGTAADEIHAVGDGGLVVYFDGSDWNEFVADGGTIDLKAIWGCTSGSPGATIHEYHAVGVGGSGLVYISGGSASRMNSNVGQRRNDIFGLSSSEIYTAGVGGTVQKGRGSAWDQMWIPDSIDLYGVWASASDDVYVVGEGGAIYHWDGEEWEKMKSLIGTALNSVFGLPDGRVFAAGVNGTVLVLD